MLLIAFLRTIRCKRLNSVLNFYNVYVLWLFPQNPFHLCYKIARSIKEWAQMEEWPKLSNQPGESHYLASSGVRHQAQLTRAWLSCSRWCQIEGVALVRLRSALGWDSFSLETHRKMLNIVILSCEDEEYTAILPPAWGWNRYKK